MTVNTTNHICTPIEAAPNVETVRALIAKHTNWGRWGDEDQVGTLNHVTPENVVQAAATIRTAIATAS